MKGLLYIIICLAVMAACSKKTIDHVVLTKQIKQYEKTEFTINIPKQYRNPYDQREVTLDMVLRAPSGKKLSLPCFYDVTTTQTLWRARFAPQESGSYSYHFVLREAGKEVMKSDATTFESLSSGNDGFLHTHDFWTLRFDSGKPFRGIGENVGWENRTYEDKKWTYDYLLPTLSTNGANFYRTWMCYWNMPLAFPKVKDTDRYVNEDSIFHTGGIKRMDELVELSDSLKLYFMLSIDAHGAFLHDGWPLNAHNKVNGGPAATPTEFFTNEESRAMYKDRLRYMVARWGYSPSIAAWEFFNEIDNAVFTPTPHDSVLIDHKIITSWHHEMSTYLKSIDPYQHIVTTSVSHREIDGMNDLPNMDLNQKHIYNKTHLIAPTIQEYSKKHHKPYVIGEFGYDWNWDNVKHEVGPEFDFDYKRGLWYGLFSPTPILPMTWWWEFFDERGMTTYFQSVRQINDRMMAAGKGSFVEEKVTALGVESYAVACGSSHFIYLLNNSKDTKTCVIETPYKIEGDYTVEYFTPENRKAELVNAKNFSGKLPSLKLDAGKDIILIISSAQGGSTASTETTQKL